MIEQVLEMPLVLKVNHYKFCSAVIVAGGKGRRMESKVNKVYIDLLGKKAIVRTLEPFQRSPLIDEIILVVNQNDLGYCESEVIDRSIFTKIKKIISGGMKRQDSVYNGLKEVSEKAELILIHDGARPLVTEDIIERSIQDAIKYGAVAVGVPVKDTIKIVDNEGFVADTLKRDTLWAVQTPQVFRRNIIFEAHSKARELGIQATDDCMLVEKLGYKVKITEGSYENIKLTTPEDVIIACALIKDREFEW